MVGLREEVDQREVRRSIATRHQALDVTGKRSRIARNQGQPRRTDSPRPVHRLVPEPRSGRVRRRKVRSFGGILQERANLWMHQPDWQTGPSCIAPQAPDGRN